MTANLLGTLVMLLPLIQNPYTPSITQDYQAPSKPGPTVQSHLKKVGAHTGVSGKTLRFNHNLADYARTYPFQRRGFHKQRGQKTDPISYSPYDKDSQKRPPISFGNPES